MEAFGLQGRGRLCLPVSVHTPTLPAGGFLETRPCLGGGNVLIVLALNPWSMHSLLLPENGCLGNGPRAGPAPLRWVTFSSVASGSKEWFVRPGQQA